MLFKQKGSIIAIYFTYSSFPIVSISKSSVASVALFISSHSLTNISSFSMLLNLVKDNIICIVTFCHRSSSCLFDLHVRLFYYISEFINTRYAWFIKMTLLVSKTMIHIFLASLIADYFRVSPFHSQALGCRIRKFLRQVLKPSHEFKREF